LPFLFIFLCLLRAESVPDDANVALLLMLMVECHVSSTDLNDGNSQRTTGFSNPTGQVLSRENLHDIVKFCAERNLVLLADEVYQENVYDENSAFVSAKRAAYETGLLDDNDGGGIELISFHSVSKGKQVLC